MSAFLDLNGVPASGNRRLLTDVLRGEWGFDGFVVSDRDSVLELVNHGVAEDAAHAGAIALHAGVDMDMVSNTYLNTLAASLQNGKVSQDDIDEAVCRILRIKFRAGLFDQPFTDPDRATRDLLRPESRSLARQFARETMVLLKNENGLLPLGANFKKIAVVGPLIHARNELFGCWSPDGRGADVTPLYEALKQIAPNGVKLVFADHADKAVHIAHDGGHSRQILERLSPRGRLIAVDRDAEAGAAAAAIADPRLDFVHTRFSRLSATLAALGVARLHGLLLDLGGSSPQIDEAQRGLSLRADALLDMRMDRSGGTTAAEWLASATQDELVRVIREYGEERFAASIAKAVVARREAGRPLATTAELAALVASAIPVRNRRDAAQHPATRTFQAVRIHINQELEELALVLAQSVSLLTLCLP